MRRVHISFCYMQMCYICTCLNILVYICMSNLCIWLFILTWFIAQMQLVVVIYLTKGQVNKIQYICWLGSFRDHSKLTVLHNLMACSEENVHSITANGISHTLLYWMSAPFPGCIVLIHFIWLSALLHLSLFWQANLFTISVICTKSASHSCAQLTQGTCVCARANPTKSVYYR